MLIEDENLTDLSPLPSIRLATPEDLVLISASFKIGQPVDDNPDLTWGLTAPLADEDVLIPTEINAISIATNAYNTAIKDFADADENLLMVDVASLLSEIKSGLDYGTGYVDAAYIDGGAFSLDGVHPTARGYAIIANTIIEVINSGFDAKLPTVDPSTYTTIFVE